MVKKKTITKINTINKLLGIFLVIIAVLFVGLVAIPSLDSYDEDRDCADDRKGMTGECLPDGDCVAPNDGIVPCSDPDDRGDYKSGTLKVE